MVHALYPHCRRAERDGIELVGSLSMISTFYFRIYRMLDFIPAYSKIHGNQLIQLDEPHVSYPPGKLGMFTIHVHQIIHLTEKRKDVVTG